MRSAHPEAPGPGKGRSSKGHPSAGRVWGLQEAFLSCHWVCRAAGGRGTGRGGGIRLAGLSSSATQSCGGLECRIISLPVSPRVQNGADNTLRDGC